MSERPSEPARPELSIVVISFNTREMTHDCLSSVVSGLGDLSAELIVVDNASTDGSADMIAQSFPQATLIRNTDNRGFAAANNQAFKVAKGHFILLLNSDTLVLGNVLSRSVAFLRENPSVAAMGCRVLNPDRTLQRTCSMEPSLLNLTLMLFALDKLRHPRWFGRYQYRHWDRLSQKDVEVISGCYLMTRATIFASVGALDESFFFFGEETDWCMRVRKAGWRCTLAPIGEIIHYGGGSVKKLNHSRDVMLTDALVRLHRKHHGRLVSALIWMVLFTFNSSRWVGYRFAATITPTQRLRERAEHFRRVSSSLLAERVPRRNTTSTS